MGENSTPVLLITADRDNQCWSLGDMPVRSWTHFVPPHRHHGHRESWFMRILRSICFPVVEISVAVGVLFWGFVVAEAHDN
jgi:hypothetical protein